MADAGHADFFDPSLQGPIVARLSISPTGYELAGAMSTRLPNGLWRRAIRSGYGGLLAGRGSACRWNE
ncbi:hypothetical protein A5740_17090 [Mycobacterium sp. GA-1841]|nr:hypothetical protein A5740_17090 [Mycobacterium sp. GA-1841]